MLKVYIPILVLALLGLGFAAFSVAVGTFVAGPKRWNKAKMVRFYVTAMLFIVFDIEIVFLYPWAVTFGKLGAFGLVEMVTFVLTVLIAYAYVWRRGGLEWD
jgi:NADH-quinone oxidoreductase subunit A